MAEPIAELDHAHVWHPFTPCSATGARPSRWSIERAEGSYLIDVDGRRYLDGVVLAVVQRPRPPRTRASTRRCATQLDRVAHSTLLGLTHRRRRRARAAAGRDRAAGPDARLLLRRRGRPRSRSRSRWRSSTGAAQGEPEPADPVRRPRGRLPRRHARLGGGRRDRPLPPRCSARCCSTTLPLRSSRATSRDAASGCSTLHARRDRRRDRRAARAGGRRDARPAAGLPAPRPRALPTSTACC